MTYSTHTLPCIRPIGEVIAPYSERKAALAEQRHREMRDAIQAIRVHSGVNLVRETAFDRSVRSQREI
jgi:hypothetical protein